MEGNASTGAQNICDNSPFNDMKGKIKTGQTCLSEMRADWCSWKGRNVFVVCACTPVYKSLFVFARGFRPRGEDILALYPNQKELLNVKNLTDLPKRKS